MPGLKSAAVLKMAGAFDKHPERAREDAPGAAPLDNTPPAELTEPQQGAWRELVACLPRIAITQSERHGLVQMARVWEALKHVDPLSAEFIKLDAAFRNWCMQMGMTLMSRIKMGSGGQNQKPQKFEQLKERKSA
jgi:hypothetical protein